MPSSCEDMWVFLFLCFPTTTIGIYTTIPAMKHQHKLDSKSDLPLFSYGYRKCMFVGFLARRVGPLSCVHYWGAINYEW